MWLKNTAGVKDSMLTFAVGGFLVSAFAVISSFLEKITVGTFELVLKSPDVALVTAFMGATLVAYVTRRNKKDDLLAKEKELRLRHELGLSIDVDIEE